MQAEKSTKQFYFLQSLATRPLIITTAILNVLYFIAIIFLFPIGNHILFALLALTQAYYLWMAFTFWWTIWDTDYKAPFDPDCNPSVSVFITASKEPLDIIEKTARAARDMSYNKHKVYILNDGYALGNPEWQKIEGLAEKLGVGCITRKNNTGAKAGNINNAIRFTKSDLIAVFDTDHVPDPDFLKKTVGYFGDPKMGFVQTPQYYKNHDLNLVTSGSWEQQELFFGAICEGKNRLNAAFLCGTNMVIRRKALEEIGGMHEQSITEDFLTSVYLHSRGWRSYFLPEVLAEGLAPEDFLSYYKQQMRWSRGCLEVIFKHNPIFIRGLTWKQRLQYLASASFYLSGIIVLINAILPLIFFFTGAVPLLISTMSIAALFLPFIFMSLYILQLSTNHSYTYTALAFSLSSFTIYLKSLLMIIFGIKQGFSVTSKTAISGNFLSLSIPHIGYLILTVLGAGYAIAHFGANASVVTNIAWALIDCAIFTAFIAASAPTRTRTYIQEKRHD